MVGPGSDKDERARRLRERFAAASPQPARPKPPNLAKPPGANASLVIWAVVIGLSIVYAIWKSL